MLSLSKGSEWTVADFKILVDIIKCSKRARTFTIELTVEQQESAEILFELLIKMVHCNSQAKIINLQIDFKLNPDWSFINADFNSTGEGSIKELTIVQYGEPITSSPAWKFLTQSVSIEKGSVFSPFYIF